MTTWYRLFSGDGNHVAKPLYATISNIGSDLARSILFSRGGRIETWPTDAYYKAGDPSHDGEPEDFLLEVEGLPVVSERLRFALEQFGETGHQFLPIKVLHADGSLAGQYYVVNVLDVPRVLDLSLSRFERTEYKTNAQGETIPDLIGLWKPVLRSDWAAGHHLFRCAEAPLVLVASEDLRQVFQRIAASGSTFRPLDVI